MTGLQRSKISLFTGAQLCDSLGGFMNEGVFGCLSEMKNDALIKKKLGSISEAAGIYHYEPRCLRCW